MEDGGAAPGLFYKYNKSFPGLTSNEDGVELKSFISCIKWVCLDQSTRWRACLSWSIFFLLAIGVPLLSHLVYDCSACDETHRRPFDAVVQLSLSVFATISFLCLSAWTRRYGLRRFLFLDKLCHVSQKVREGYAEQLQQSMKLLCIFVLPGFTAEAVYKVWWYISGANQIPYYNNVYASDAIICLLMFCSWLYRTSLYIFVCLLLRLTCYLQILRLEDFAQVFQRETEVAPILKEHLSIRRNLRVISHRFRAFILLSLLLVTASQFSALLMTTRTSAHLNIFKAGELVLCSMGLVTGLFICLRSATKITHKAQSITSLAAKWHICSTIDSYDVADGESPRAHVGEARVFADVSCWDQSDEEDGDDDDMDNTKILPHYAHTISFQKRQALVTYLENNKAGVTVFGFVLDRSWVHTICGIQLALMLWLLNKTIGIS